MIHIGIDVTHIFWPVKTGVHRYCYGLIKGMVALGNMSDFHVSLLDFNQQDQHRSWLPSQLNAVEYKSASALPMLPTFDTNVLSGQLNIPMRLWNKGVRGLRATALNLGAMPRHVLADIDVLHAWHLKPVSGAKKSTIMIHDAYQLLNPNLFHNDVVKSHQKCLEFAKNEASIVLVPSHYTAHAIVHELGVEESKVRVIHHGIEATFKPIQSSEQQTNILNKYHISDKPYILSVGYLDPRKNVEGHLKAFEDVALQPGFEDLHFVLVGPNDARTDSLLDFIQLSKVRDRIIITGFVQEKDLPSLYSHASVFVYCSHYEGFGLPIIEAMACGTPVITSNSTCLPEVAGDAAIIVDSETIDDIGRAMLDVLSDKTLHQSLVDKGLRRSATFTWENSAREHLMAYKDCL